MREDLRGATQDACVGPCLSGDRGVLETAYAGTSADGLKVREAGAPRNPSEGSEVSAAASTHQQATIVVVGAGVSGCACAASLARAGLRVTVVSSALDVVGLPDYGPEIVVGSGGWAEIVKTMILLPQDLRLAWISSAAVSGTGLPILVVDRRAVSIETKRALEVIPGLEFRQGLVVNIRLVMDSDSRSDRELVSGGVEASRGGDRGWVEVETAFGEVFRADVAVLAVGLGLGGWVEAGEEVLPGGRYGEVPSEGLREALEALGSVIEMQTVQVGSCHSVGSPVVSDAVDLAARCGREGSALSVGSILSGGCGGSAGPTNTQLEEARQALVRCVLGEEDDGSPNEANILDRSEKQEGIGSGGIVSARNRERQGEIEGWLEGLWPEGLPPAPHRTDALRADSLLVRRVPSAKGVCAGVEEDAVVVASLAPDGAATAEYYVAPGEASWPSKAVRDERDCSEFRTMTPATRLEHKVVSLRLTGLDGEGRLAGAGSRVWVAGRAGGARSYLESLRSGVEVARSVIGELRRPGRS